jgi:RNA polymerase sigma-70 factor (ECF subfamily)
MAAPEVPWLQPIPDALLASPHDDPAQAAASRAGTRLAMVAALQYLSARQRAMLILRDVLDWPAAEVAAMLDTTTTAVNSGLRRARAQLARALPDEDDVAEPAEPEYRALLDRFALAFENGDVTELTALLRQDVALEMPPMLTWFAGRENVRRFLATKLFGTPGQFRLVPTRANGQPAFAAYEREHDGVYRAHAALVLTITATGIARIVIFLSPGLLGAFGLPHEYGAGGPASAPDPAATPWPSTAPDLAVPTWPR